VKQQLDLTWWSLRQVRQRLLGQEGSWSRWMGLVLAVSLLGTMASPMGWGEDHPILLDTPTPNTYIPAVPLVPGLWQKPYYPQQRQQTLTTDRMPASAIPPVPMAMPAVESPDMTTMSTTQPERPLAEDLAAKYGVSQEPTSAATNPTVTPQIHALSPSLGPVTDRPATASATLPVSNNRTDTSVYEKTLSWPYDAASPEAMRQQEAEGRQAQLNAMRAQQQAEAQAKAAREAAQKAIELAAKRKAEQAALSARQASAQERAAALKQQQAAETARQAALNQQRQAERLAAQKAAEARAQAAANARAIAQAKAKALAEERAQARAIAAQEAAQKAQVAREAKAQLLAEQQATEKAQAEARAAERAKARAEAQAKFEAERKARQAALAAKREAATQAATQAATSAKQMAQQPPQAKPAQPKPMRVVKAAAAQATPPNETKPATEANPPAKETPQEAYNRGVELFNYAQLQLQNGNYNGHLEQLNLAREAFENALKGDPSLIEAQSNIGYVYLTQKDYPKAIKAFDKALLLNDKHLSSLNGLATTHALRNKLAVALTYYQRLTELAPGNDQFWFNQGSILQRMDQPDGAKAAYDEALKINPKNQRAWFNIGTLYENQGAAEQALTAYQKVKSIDLSNPIGLEALNRIKRIQTEAAQKQADNLSSAAKPDVIKPVDTITK
jgi:hypothetical protein